MLKDSYHLSQIFNFLVLSVIETTALLKLEITVSTLIFITSSFRVTEENLLFETDLFGPPTLFSMFPALFKEHFFTFLFIIPWIEGGHKINIKWQNPVCK